MLTLPANMTDKINKAFQTLYADSDPRMQVIVSRTQQFIDRTERLVVETVREGADLGAIAVAAERPTPGEPPTALHMIYIVDGVAHWADLDLDPDIDADWQYRREIGEAVDVAIEFDGDWQESGGRSYFCTENQPWLVRVRGDGAVIAFNMEFTEE